jgi:histidinol phosphatase-like PHP family hydrolase
MKLPPFISQNRLYRGNLHGHSTHSDGCLSPQAVVDRYAGLGYDFTCLSDHLWIDDAFAARSVYDASSLNSANFITLPSAELHCRGKRLDQDGLWHIVANGLPVDFACPHDTETAPELIARAHAAGAYVSLAHPEWHAMTTDEALLVAAADAVEIYNHSCVLSSARGSGIAIADHLLNEGHKISFTATDDSHFDLPDFAGGWVMVAAPELSQDAIIAALKAGHHYASTGVDFTDLSLAGAVLSVGATPVDSIVISGAGHAAAARHDKNMSFAQFDLSQFHSDWFRITMRNAAGQMAWSNPYYKSDLGLS